MMTIAIALAMWGFAGMIVTVIHASLGWGVAAQSTPGIGVCTIVIDDRQATERTLLHEGGHCVGYFNVSPGVDHSADPRSVMNAVPGPDITDADRMVVFANTRWLLTHKLRTPL